MRLTRIPSVSPFFVLGEREEEEGGPGRAGQGRAGQGKESSILFLKNTIYVHYYLLINFPSNSLVPRLYGSGPTSDGTEV
jgi:hypothetical protein